MSTSSEVTNTAYAVYLHCFETAEWLRNGIEKFRYHCKDPELYVPLLEKCITARDAASTKPDLEKLIVYRNNFCTLAVGERTHVNRRLPDGAKSILVKTIRESFGKKPRLILPEGVVGTCVCCRQDDTIFES